METSQDQRTLKGDATRARLLAEAMRLFAERGYEGVSTRALASAAESNVALITFHFGSKRGLYEAALTAVENRLAEVVTPALDTLAQTMAAHRDSPERLMAAIRLLIQQLLIQLLPATPTPGFFQLLSREMHEQGGLSERLWKLFVPMMRRLEETLHAAATPERRTDEDFPALSRMAAFLLIDSILGIVRDYPVFRLHMEGHGNLEEDAAMLADLLGAGLRAALGRTGR